VIGRSLAQYRVTASIGAGGMGEVYRATDTRLGRDVAIKVLPAATAGHPERRQRFEQEARAASALNHPNILTVYDIGETDGVTYIAMELVDGKTLRELLASREPLPTKRLLDVAAQAAEGLAKAHSAGIVHRDLKPENLMVSKDGYVKILDFGLAKLTETVSQDASALPTVIGATEPGTVMGTAGYMSPEQASGQPVDFRSDQFALGAILYEMATGKRAFQRKTGAETLVAIIREEPESLGQLAPKAPAPIRWIVERLLAKDPEERYASTKDLARDLKSVRDHLEYPIGRVLHEAPGWVSDLRVSPDGRLVAFIDHPLRGDNNGNVKVVDTDGKVRLTGPFAISGLAWSPRGDEVWSSGRDSISATSLSGKTRVVWSAPAGFLQDVARDGRVLFSVNSSRREIVGYSAADRVERNLTWLNWSFPKGIASDGKTVLFEEQKVQPQGVYLRKLDGSAAVRVGDGGAWGFSPDGRWVLNLRREGDNDRFALLPTGAGEPNLLPTTGLNCQAATWFPDGRRILISGNEPGRGSRLFVP
jgi:serine/threonine protein kinase